MSATCSLIIIKHPESILENLKESEKDKRGNTRKTKNFFFLMFSLGIDKRLIANFLEKLKMCGPLFELCFVGLCGRWISKSRRHIDIS